MMTDYSCLLWDLDDTILDFPLAEKNALRKGFARLGLGECTDEMVRIYGEINTRTWARIERGEGVKERLLVERYEEFFSVLGIDPSLAEEFCRHYQTDLGDTIVFLDESDVLLRELKAAGYRQYLITNGTARAQARKLARSGLDTLMDGVFISECMGAEKPSEAYFEKVFADIAKDLSGAGPAGAKAAATLDPAALRKRSLVIGDSLRSDIAGAARAGIDACWYNRRRLPVGGASPKYIVEDLRELRELLL